MLWEDGPPEIDRSGIAWRALGLFLGRGVQTCGATEVSRERVDALRWSCIFSRW
jgi:hypothetical protein